MSHPMTITEKILSAHAGLDLVVPGELVMGADSCTCTEGDEGISITLCAESVFGG